MNIHNRTKNIFCTTAAAILFFTVAGGAHAATTYYVAPNGSDSNVGSQTAPFKTIQKAADIVEPGDTVIVKDGVYVDSDGDRIIVLLRRGGTPDKWVTFISENKWGARLDGQNNTASYGFLFYADYIRIEGFEVFGLTYTAFISNAGRSHHEIINNHIYNIGRRCTSTGNGQNGILVSTNQMTIERNLIHDIGRFAEGEHGCYPSNTYYRNHDHGIYVSGVDGVVIRNNIFYNINRGWAIHIYRGQGSPISQNVKIENNTFAFENPYRDGHILIGDPGLINATIYNNIFYDPQTAALRISQSPYLSNVSMSRNIIYDATTSIGYTRGISFSDNLENTDPLLQDPINKNFKLKSGSPAIDAGKTIASLTNDFEGTPRPQGAAYDIGAYEFVSGETSQPPAPSPTPPSPPPPSPSPSLFSQLIEGESMTLSLPMTTGSDINAFGQSYIEAVNTTASTDPQPEATTLISIPETGTYYLWARIMGPTLSSDALYVGIDNTWDRIFPSTLNTYEWVHVETAHKTENYAFTLSQGDHIIRVGHAEPNARLDALYLTNDPNEISFNIPPVSSPPPQPLQGDLNNDNTVNSLDWSIMNSQWLTANPQSDLNNDGIVNSVDFSILNGNWNKTI